MRITRNQFLRFAVVVIGTGGTAVVACDAGTVASPGKDNPGGPLPGEDAGEGGHRGPQKPDSGTEEDAAADATADAKSDASDGGEDGGADAGEDAPVAVPACEQNGGRDFAISGHPGHALLIPAADFQNIQPTQTYDIKGPHVHTLTLTAVEMNQLIAGQTVVVTSTTGGVDNHTHNVTVVCA